MTAPLDALNRLDDGLPLTDADHIVLAVFERHAQDDWARFDLALAACEAERCQICGKTGEGRECDSCTADWDKHIDRGSDL